jgi:hypothetical protein
MSSVCNALDFEPTPFNLPWNTSAEHGAHGSVETPRVESEPMNDEKREHLPEETPENAVSRDLSSGRGRARRRGRPRGRIRGHASRLEGANASRSGRGSIHRQPTEGWTFRNKDDTPDFIKMDESFVESLLAERARQFAAASLSKTETELNARQLPRTRAAHVDLFADDILRLCLKWLNEHISLTRQDSLPLVSEVEEASGLRAPDESEKTHGSSVSRHYIR